MKQMCLETMSDRDVVERLHALLGEERRLTASVLAHLGEVEARRLYLPAACSSMHVYCVRVLGMSEDQAYKRIRAARAMRRFPVVGTAVAEGRLHLSGVVLLAPHLTEESAEGLVAEASGKSRAEIEILLARRAPRADAPERLERVGEQKKPRAAAKASKSRRYVPRAARREAVARGGARCSFVAGDGRRCEETGFLELDHEVPVAQGGDASDGVRILCRSHNQHEARRLLGRVVVEAGRARRAAAGRDPAPARCTLGDTG
jgi:hypothetical protein